MVKHQIIIRRQNAIRRQSVIRKGVLKMSYTKVNNTRAGKMDGNELKQWMSVDEIRFDKIYVNAIPLEGGVEIYGYVRAWKNGKVGYSALDEATDEPDFSDCGIFWVAPEDFAKVFMVYGDRADSNNDNGSSEGADTANLDSIFQFREKVEKAIMDMAPTDIKADLTLDEVEIVKINDQKLYGLVFKIEGMSSSPTFYLNEPYEQYIHGESIGNIVKQLVNSFLFSIEGMSEEVETKLKRDAEVGFDDMKDRLTVKVLEISRNQEYLKTVPHKEIGLGFAVVFDVQTVVGGNDVYRMPVTEAILKKAKIDEDELFEIAMDNVSEVDPAVLISLERGVSNKRVKNLLENGRHINKKKPMMYVLTNRCGRFGAAALFYPGMQKRIADIFDDSYYAIPSSVNEFILTPESSGANMEKLCERLLIDNYSTENQEDVLSDRVFHYDRKWDQLICINDMIGEDGAEC